MMLMNRFALAVVWLVSSACGVGPNLDRPGATDPSKGEASEKLQRYALVWGHSFDVDLRQQDDGGYSPIHREVDLKRDVVVREGCSIGKSGINVTAGEAALLLPQNGNNGSALDSSMRSGNGGLSLASRPASEYGFDYQSAAYWAYEFRSGYAGFWRLNRYHWARLIQIARDRLRAADDRSRALVKFHCIYGLYALDSPDVGDRQTAEEELRRQAAQQYIRRRDFVNVSPYVEQSADGALPLFVPHAAIDPYRAVDKANRQLQAQYVQLSADDKRALVADLIALNEVWRFLKCFENLRSTNGDSANLIYPTTCGLEVEVTAETELTPACETFLDAEQRRAGGR